MGRLSLMCEMRDISRAVLLTAIIALVILPAGCKGKKRSPVSLLSGTGRICGTVVDEDGVPIQMALVYVEGLANAAITDERGRYVISGLPKGTYTVVVVLPGYRRAVRTNVSVADKRMTSGIDLTLVRDPNYEPDMIRFIEVSPVEGTRIECGKPVFISGRIQYVLKNARWGTIYIFIVDEAGKQMFESNLSRISAMAGEHIVPFGRQVIIPQNVSGRIWLVAALFAGQEASARAADTVAYSTGVARDEVVFTGSEPPFGAEILANEPVRIGLKLRWMLESVNKALLKVELVGGTQSGRYTVVLAEKETPLERAGLEPQELEIELECIPRIGMPAVKARALMMTADGKSTIAAAWSPRFIVVTAKEAGKQ